MRPRRARKVYLAAAGALLAAAGGTALLLLPGREPPPPPPELPETAGVDSAVVRRVAEALRDARSAPGDARARLALARVYHANELLEPAREAYRQTVALDPSLAKAWYLLALVDHRLGLAEDASRALESARELAPSYPPVHWRLGFWRLEANELDAAEDAFLTAKRIDSRGPEPDLGLSLVAGRRGEHARAAGILRGVLRRDPEHEYARYLFGRSLKHLGRTEHAASLLRATRGNMFRGRDPWFEELSGLKAGYGAQVRQAHELLRDRLAGRALDILRPLHESRPDDVTVAVLLGTALAATGDAEGALAVFESAAGRDPENQYVHIKLAEEYHRRKRKDEALEHVRMALQVQPHSLAARWLEASILVESGEPREALRAMERAIECGPPTREVLLFKGNLEVSLKRWDDALATLETAARRYPGDADVLLALSLAQERAGRLAGAEETLAKAAALHPDHPEIPVARLRLRLLRDAHE